jgi:hypothetical protein
VLSQTSWKIAVALDVSGHAPRYDGVVFIDD